MSLFPRCSWKDKSKSLAQAHPAGQCQMLETAQHSCPSAQHSTAPFSVLRADYWCVIYLLVVASQIVRPPSRYTSFLLPVYSRALSVKVLTCRVGCSLAINVFIYCHSSFWPYFLFLLTKLEARLL